MSVQPYCWERFIDFVETDMAGIVHFSNFFRIMEAAETSLLRSLGYTVFATGPEGFTFPRVSAQCDYQIPIRFMDTVRVEVTVTRLTTRSVTYRFRLYVLSAPLPSSGDSNVANAGAAMRFSAEGRIVTVCCRVTPEGLRSTPVPEALRQALARAGVLEPGAESTGASEQSQ